MNAIRSISTAPGYRTLRLALESGQEVNLSPADVLRLYRASRDVLRTAWRNDGPIDIEPGEVRPDLD